MPTIRRENAARIDVIDLYRCEVLTIPVGRSPMHMTNRQKFLIANLERIIGRKRASGRQGFFLAQDDCTATINSLIVKGMVKVNENRTKLMLRELSQHLER